MRSSKHSEPRSVFDVHETKGWWHDRTLNLRPKFRIRHPWVTAAGLFVVVGIFVVGIQHIFVRAEVADFYPTSCLGTWQSPDKAQGQPESLAGPDMSNATNSAVMSGASDQIFCGSFVPQGTNETGDIKSVGLTLVWNISGLPAASTTSNVVSSTEVLGASTSTVTGVDVATSTNGASVTTSTDAMPPATSSPTSFAPRFSPFAFFIQSAYAQDVVNTDTAVSGTASEPPAPTFSASSTPFPDVATSTPSIIAMPPSQPSASTSDMPPAPSPDVATSATSVVDVPPTETSTVILGEPLSAPLAPIATDTATSTVVPAPIVLPVPPAPDENFLLVSYSIDGNTWVPLQKVNPSNWKNLTLSLPISSWHDLEKLQIKIESIPTALEAMPKIFLDGMFMEVHYDLPPVFTTGEGADTNASSGPKVIMVSPGVTIETPPENPTPFVPEPSIVSIDVASDTVSVNVQYVGDFYGGNPLYLFMYPQGTTADRDGPDAAYMFAGQPGSPSINGLLVGPDALDPSTKQGDITIVRPMATDNRIATADMTPGTYVVDIAYFDSNIWHLIPPQTFIWQ